MPVYAINVPPCNTIDSLAEQREQRDERTRARMSQTRFEDRLVEGLLDAAAEHGNPIAELVDLLFQAPCRDRYDLKAFVELRKDATRALGRALMQVIAQASLDEYEDADDEGF